MAFPARMHSSSFCGSSAGVEDYPGYPLVASADAALVWFLGVLPLLIATAWWAMRRPPRIASLASPNGGIWKTTNFRSTTTATNPNPPGQVVNIPNPAWIPVAEKTTGLSYKALAISDAANSIPIVVPTSAIWLR